MPSCTKYPKYKVYHLIAHSLGGILVCKCIDKLQLENIDKCVFIATPFTGSKFADFGDRIPFYSKILKPNKELKVTDDYLKICNKVAARIPVGLIASNKHSRFNFLAKYCLKSDHDGLVEVASVFAINSANRIILNKNHRKIHHDDETLSKMAYFLQTGKFLI